MRYLVALRKWDEAMREIPVVKRPGQNNRAEGPLEFDVPIAVQIRAEGDENAYKYGDFMTVHWVEFHRDDAGAVKADLVMILGDWPRGKWRVQVELLNATLTVLSRAEWVHEASGSIEEVPLEPLTTRRPVELGHWNDIAAATRFSAAIETVMGESKVK